jgi:phosphatidylglycerol---prolipoprotein diacylglyceryl transferase
MRPLLVKTLSEYLPVRAAEWVVPDLALVYAAAIMTGMLVFVRRARQARLSEYHAWGAMLCGTLGAIVGGRLWYLLTHADRLLRHPSIALDVGGPNVSFGAYLFGALAFAAYLACVREQLPAYCDVLASGLGLGPMIGRWSCFLNGDDFGTVTSMPWGVRFPAGSYVFADHVNRGYVGLTDDFSLAVHPVQLYLSLKGLVLFVLCTWLWRSNRLRSGVLLGVFWLSYALLRFSIEFFRGDDTAGYWNGLTSGQCTCAVIALASLAYLAAMAPLVAPVERTTLACELRASALDCGEGAGRTV